MDRSEAPFTQEEAQLKPSFPQYAFLTVFPAKKDTMSFYLPPLCF